MNRRVWLVAFATLVLAACGGGGTVVPPVKTPAGAGVVDYGRASCIVSFDGLISYALPAGSFSPIDVRTSSCAPSALAQNANAAMPAWAQPAGHTQTLFVATSLQEAYSIPGMESIELAAAPHHVPVTWMVDDGAYLANAALYTGYHIANGDDVEVSRDPGFIASAEAALAWYTPAVSVEGAGHERDIHQDLQDGDSAFWGITWNSHGTDLTDDYGAPWGAYCADPSSYKRPSPDGSCAELAFEWTARDLTRAYLSGHEELFSTDPDDLQRRAGFSAAGAQAYVRRLVDAYAAAGETQPIVMISQQESAEDVRPGDPQILEAMYDRAASDGMRTVTLRAAASLIRSAAAQPRAVAFPYVPGGTIVPSIVDGSMLYPATIDYHDDVAGMTFLAGHTTPSRVFEYRDYPVSAFNVPLPQVSAADLPALTGAAVHNGTLALQFQAPVALHYGVALWTNPQPLGLAGSHVTNAGRAGVVLTFDLQPGPNEITFTCSGCTTATFPYST